MLAARAAAILLPAFSVEAALPTTASLASDERCRFSEISSRQAFASLSTRAGRFLSLSKVIEQRADCVGGGGGAVGASIVTVVGPLAVCHLSSATVQVMVTVPGAAPAEAKVAELPVPLTEPAEAE